MSLRFLLSALGISICLYGPIAATDSPVGSSVYSHSKDLFSAKRFETHVRRISADEMSGRWPGTEGFDKAAAYVASQFETLGLQKLFASDHYYQLIPMQETRPDRRGAKFVVHRKAGYGRTAVTAFRYFDQFYTDFDNSRAESAVTAEAVFVGYGISAPELGVDAYTGLDVGGKIAVMLEGAPKSFGKDVAAYFSMVEQKKLAAAEKGAVGVVILSTAEPAVFLRDFTSRIGPWVSWQRTRREAVPGSRIQVTTFLSRPAAEMLFAGEGETFTQVMEAARAGTVRGFPLSRRIGLAQKSLHTPIEGKNVIGVLRGSDPKLRDEYVVLMAHLDHLGIAKSFARDKIYNGAMDNATGVATILEVAWAFAQAGERPRRSILFLADTGDETGYSGTDYFAKHLPVPSTSVIAVLNVDMPYLLYPLKGDKAGIFIYGSEHSTLGQSATEAAAQLGILTLPVHPDEHTRFPRSDHAPLMELGIPCLRIKPGYTSHDELNRAERVRDFQRNHYHKVSDDITQPIDYKAGADYAAIHYALARNLANAEQRPTWNPESFLAKRFNRRTPP